jgi:hypothetical protein
MRCQALAFVLALVVACSSTPSHKQLEPSGFLKDWSQLQPHPDPERKGALLYVKPGLDLSKYTSVYLPTPSVLVDPKEVGITPSQMAGVADDFVLSIHRSLRPDYQLVKELAPRSIVLRVAITDVEKTGGLNQSVRVLTGRGLDSSGVDPKHQTRSIEIDAMGIEAELIDPQTHERLVALAEYQTAQRMRSSRTETWGTIQSALDFWAGRLREALDQARARRGEAPTPGT